MQKLRVSKPAFHDILANNGMSGGMRSRYIPPVFCLAMTLELLVSGGYQWLAFRNHTVSVGQNPICVQI